MRKIWLPSVLLTAFVVGFVLVAYLVSTWAVEPADVPDYSEEFAGLKGKDIALDGKADAIGKKVDLLAQTCQREFATLHGYIRALRKGQIAEIVQKPMMKRPKGYVPPGWAETYQDVFIADDVVIYDAGDGFTTNQLRQMFNKEALKASELVGQTFVDGLVSIEEAIKRQLSKSEQDDLFKQTANVRREMFDHLWASLDLRMKLIADMTVDETYKVCKPMGGAFDFPVLPEKHTRIAMSTKDGEMRVYDISRTDYPTVLTKSRLRDEYKHIVIDAMLEPYTD